MTVDRRADQWNGTLTPVIVCSPSMQSQAEQIAEEFSRYYPTGVHVSSYMTTTVSAVYLVDPFRRLDPAVVALVLNKYQPGKTWTPEDSWTQGE